MLNVRAMVPSPKNEPVLGYLPGSKETQELKAQLAEFSRSSCEIPLIINGEEVRTVQTAAVTVPHNHEQKIATYHLAGEREIEMAIAGSQKAFSEWSRMSYEDRAAIFLKAAELLTTKYRQILNASTMLGQSKTCHQAEIDSACELIDFWRFNPHYQEQLLAIQPQSGPGAWNRLEYRPLEGFVFAITPFNFTSIAGNLPTAPALMGNVVLWKPASTQVFSAYFIMKLLKEAGLPDGVIQFLPGPGSKMGDLVLKHPLLAGVHFTGSTSTFHHIWETVGSRIGSYRSYPRLVGETGGKDFVVAHASADASALVTALIRGAFEYQGQKCSAASRAYVPQSLWTAVKKQLVGQIESIPMGDVADFKNFMGAVIDRKSFEKIRGYLEEASGSSEAKILAGGKANGNQGYFISPTLIEVSNPKYRTMCEEIFGPVLTVFPYEDGRYEEILRVCDETSPYALTGSIFAQDRKALNLAEERLTHSAGNFYINNKPTGAVVGQQPFGGGRASGTNDKAGSLFNLLRWVSMRTVSETFAPPTDYRYPFMN